MFKVCIRSYTYNHSHYIEDTMNGFVMQKTSFPFVALIVDDASTDGTSQIITDYFYSYFDTENSSTAFREEADFGTVLFSNHRMNSNCYFAIVLLKENHYSRGKSKRQYLRRWMDDSEYIAYCEGDDYWIDPDKLQKQVSILGENQDFMAVVTNSMVVDKEGAILASQMVNVVPDNIEGRYTLHDYFRNVHHYPTATVVFRNNHSSDVHRMMSHTNNKYLGDWTLWAILHSFGDFFYWDRVTSAYRINPTSSTHVVDRVGRAKANLTICQSLSEVLPTEYSKYLKKAGWMYFSVFMAYRKEKRWSRMLSSLFICFFKFPTYTIKRLIHIAQGVE